MIWQVLVIMEKLPFPGWHHDCRKKSIKPFFQIHVYASNFVIIISTSLMVIKIGCKTSQRKIKSHFLCKIILESLQINHLQHLQVLSSWPGVDITASDVCLPYHWAPWSLEWDFLFSGCNSARVSTCYETFGCPCSPSTCTTHISVCAWSLQSMIFGIGIIQLLWSQQRQLLACSSWQVMPIIFHQVTQTHKISSYIMACCLICNKPSSVPTVTDCW